MILHCFGLYPLFSFKIINIQLSHFCYLTLSLAVLFPVFFKFQRVGTMGRNLYFLLSRIGRNLCLNYTILTKNIFLSSSFHASYCPMVVLHVFRRLVHISSDLTHPSNYSCLASFLFFPPQWLYRRIPIYLRSLNQVTFLSPYLNTVNMSFFTSFYFILFF